MLSTMEAVLKAHLSFLKNEKDGEPPPIEESFVRKQEREDVGSVAIPVAAE